MSSEISDSIAVAKRDKRKIEGLRGAAGRVRSKGNLKRKLIGRVGGVENYHKGD